MGLFSGLGAVTNLLRSEQVGGATTAREEPCDWSVEIWESKLSVPETGGFP